MELALTILGYIRDKAFLTLKASRGSVVMWLSSRVTAPEPACNYKVIETPIQKHFQRHEEEPQAHKH